MRTIARRLANSRRAAGLSHERHADRQVRPTQVTTRSSLGLFVFPLFGLFVFPLFGVLRIGILFCARDITHSRLTSCHGYTRIVRNEAPLGPAARAFMPVAIARPLRDPAL